MKESTGPRVCQLSQCPSDLCDLKLCCIGIVLLMGYGWAFANNQAHDLFEPSLVNKSKYKFYDLGAPMIGTGFK